MRLPNCPITGIPLPLSLTQAILSPPSEREGRVKVQLKGIVEDADRHGNVRIYYRAKGRPKVRLRETFGTPAFMDEYRCAEAGIPYETVSAKPKPVGSKPSEGTLTHLCQEYYRRAANDVSTDTMYKRRRVLERICQTYGEARWRDLNSRELVAIRDEMAPTNGARNNIIKAVGALFSWANDVHLADFNPAHGVKRLKSGDGFHAWTVEEVEAFVKRHPKGTNPFRALVFFLFTGLRVSDLARLSWKNIGNGRIIIVPPKTKDSSGVTVDIPILPPLMEQIEITPREQPAFMITQYGKPFSVKSFGQKFSGWCDQAGLPHCSAHGVRKVGAAIAAELGATEHQLMAIYGWTTTEQATLYTKSANRRRLSDQGMSLVTDAWSKVLNVPLSGAS